jgi:transposase
MQASPNIDYKGLYETEQNRTQQLEFKLLQLTHELNQMKKMIFGSRHERFAPLIENTSQLSLGIQVEAVATCSVTDAKKITYTKNITEQKLIQHPGRMKLPEHLRREEIFIDPKENIAGYKKIGEEITEVLEYKAGELYVKKYIRAKYAAPNNESIVIGTLPSRPLDKAIAGASLLAQIAIDKYIDHLPLHRQMQRFERSGVKLNYATITDWVSATCKLITPLYEA